MISILTKNDKNEKPKKKVVFSDEKGKKLAETREFVFVKVIALYGYTN